MAHEFLVNTLNTVKKELENRRKRPEEARKYLAEAVKKYALQRGATEKPRDRYDIAKDPGLAALKDVYVKGTQPPDVRARGFARLFFDPTRPYEGEFWPRDLSLDPEMLCENGWDGEWDPASAKCTLTSN